MYRPSGEKLGCHSPSEPGSVETWRVLRFKILIARPLDFASLVGSWPKTRDSPSADQLEQISVNVANGYSQGLSTQSVSDAAGDTFYATTIADAAGKPAPLPGLGGVGCGISIGTPLACSDVAIYKYSAAGVLDFITYLAGEDQEIAGFVAIAPDGALVVARLAAPAGTKKLVINVDWTVVWSSSAKSQPQTRKIGANVMRVVLIDGFFQLASDITKIFQRNAIPFMWPEMKDLQSVLPKLDRIEKRGKIDVYSSLAKTMVMLGPVASLVGGIDSPVTIKGDASVNVNVGAKAALKVGLGDKAQAESHGQPNKAAKSTASTKKTIKSEILKENTMKNLINSGNKNVWKKASSLLGE
jgi:hypothetical protein